VRYLCEQLGRTEGLVETEGFKKATESYAMTNERECQQGSSEFHTEGAATLKPQETKVVWT